MSNLFAKDKDIKDVDIKNSIQESYLDYSMSVIIGRALPNARDGFKPVHRRTLYAMHELKLTSKSSYKKSARVVGDVIGKFHPHGDTSVYDALVRLAQPFSMREPIIDGQGNFGSIDGDSPAAMRYTEVRMTPIAEHILKDIEKDTVEFVPNYDASLREPDILPSAIPNLLLNGASGIAVGMSTNIPPHRADELIDALVYLIDNKDVSLNDIMEFLKGPDFPTGGTIFGKNGILEAYKTGRGKIKLRAKTHIEKKNNKEFIIIDEFPYQVSKSSVVEKIADLVRNKQINDIVNIRDESDRNGIRVVIELKRDSLSEIVINNLYKSTSLEVTFGIIMLAIENREPTIFSLLELLNIFLKHRKTVVIRRTIFDLEKAKSRAHILEGLNIAMDNIDEVIACIKKSKDAKSSKVLLQDRFKFTLQQAEAILNMRLQRLTSLERDKIKQELKELKKEIAWLSSILKDENILSGVIREELLEVKKKFSSPRRTDIIDSYDEIDIKDLIPNEEMVVTLTHRGYIKRVPLKNYERQNRGGKGKIALTIYKDDFIKNFFVSYSHDTLMIVSSFGRIYMLRVYEIPEGGRTSKGKAIVNIINFSSEEEKLESIIAVNDFSSNKSLVFFTKLGLVKRTNLLEFKNVRANGIIAMSLREDDELVSAYMVDDSSKHILIFTKNGMSIKFCVSSIKEIGRNTKGVMGIRLNDNDYVVSASLIKRDDQELLTVSSKGVGKRTLANNFRLQKRAGKGIISMKLTKKTGYVIGSVVTDKKDKEDLILLTNRGKMIRVDESSIRRTNRNASGVKIVRLEDSDSVVDIQRCSKEDDSTSLKD